MRRVFPAFLPLLLWLACASAAHAQASVEDRLRDAVRKLTTELNAAQGALGPLQAQLDAMTKQRDALQAQLDTAKAQLAQPPPAPPIDPEQLRQLQADLAAAHKDNAELQAALAKWQAAYKAAAAVAQARDADAKRLDAALQATTTSLRACRDANASLVKTARSILHLYETPQFRHLVIQSYESLLGLKRTELENLVQDYDDKIEDGRLPAQPATAAPAVAQ